MKVAVMTNTNITVFRKNVFGFVDQAVTYGDVVNVTTKNRNAVIISESDYNSLLETMHLCSIHDVESSIEKAEAEPLDGCVPYDPEEAW